MKKETLNFLSELKDNNKKAWFDENRKRYQEARKEFVDFIEDLILEISKFDENIQGIDAKKTLMRINRDIRFSKDKTPYKLFLGAKIRMGVKKNVSAGYFIRIGNGMSGIAGGLPMLDSTTLSQVRKGIVKNSAELIKIINDKSFKETFKEIVGEKLKNPPRGYSKDHSMIEFLKFKEFIVYKNYKDQEVLSEDFLKKIVNEFKIMKPLINFFNHIIQK